MSQDKTIDPVRRAEIEINAILSRLESETGRVVEGLRLNSIDVTRLDTDGKELLTGARIELRVDVGQRRWESRP